MHDGIDPAKVRAVVQLALERPLRRARACRARVRRGGDRVPRLRCPTSWPPVRSHLSDAEFVELAAWVALENFRSRFNAGLGLRSQGFSDSCEIPMPGGGRRSRRVRIHGRSEPLPDLDADDGDVRGVAFAALRHRLPHAGQRDDAEDVVQEACIRWLRRNDVDRCGRCAPTSSPIVTRLCLDQLDSARAQRETYAGPWLPEPAWSTTTSPRRAGGLLVAGVPGAPRGADAARAGHVPPARHLRLLVRRGGSLARPHAGGLPPARVPGRASTSRSAGSASTPTCNTAASSPTASWSPARRGTSRASCPCSRRTSWCGPTAAARSGPPCGRWSGRTAARASCSTWPRRSQGAPRAAVLNGQPATVFVDDDHVVSALVLDILDGSIVGVRSVSNPDKLEHLTPNFSSSLDSSPHVDACAASVEATQEPNVSSSRRRTLPEAVRGRSSTMTSSLGAAHGAMVSATTRRSSSERRGVVVRHDPGHDPFAPLGVRALPHRHLGDVGVRDQDALDEVGPHLLRAGRDDVLDPARDDEPPVGAECPASPVANQRRGRRAREPVRHRRRDSSGTAWAPGRGSRPRRCGPGAAARARPTPTRPSPLRPRRLRAQSRRRRRRNPSRSCRRWRRHWRAARRASCSRPAGRR